MSSPLLGKQEVVYLSNGHSRDNVANHAPKITVTCVICYFTTKFPKKSTWIICRTQVCLLEWLKALPLWITLFIYRKWLLTDNCYLGRPFKVVNCDVFFSFLIQTLGYCSKVKCFFFLQDYLFFINFIFIKYCLNVLRSLVLKKKKKKKKNIYIYCIYMYVCNISRLV